MNREEFEVTHIVKIPRETINCAKCKHCGEQTCVPYGFSCQYEPIIPRSTIRISQKQINDINKIVKQLQQENKQLLQKIKQLESTLNEVREWKDKNGNRYIYQDSLGEDWYFEDLDIFNELGEIIDKIGDSNE